MKKEQDYTYIESTTSLCSICKIRVSAKIVKKEHKIFISKNCPEHGNHFELLEEDASYHSSKRESDKPSTKFTPETNIKKGCPYDCGLCPEHDQHTCIGLIEITNQCNLNCPVCYANSGESKHLSIEIINAMLDYYVEAEGGDAEILQISGGEPTIHPNIIEIIELALSKKIRFIMLNTNGLKISDDIKFVQQLSKFNERFEVYLQFDGFKSTTYEYLRGENILAIKQKAIENLLKHSVPITLVSTIERGINDDEIGKIIEFGMEKKGIRGINFQPVSYFGRLPNVNTINRITLTGVINEIENQLCSIFQKGDIIPLPCNVERVAISYLIKDKKGKFTPISRKIKVNSYLPVIENTFAFDADRILSKQVNQLQLCDCFKLINDIHKLIPKTYLFKSDSQKKAFIDESTFRLSITSFVDHYNFDMKSIQKECVHIITPDLKRIPFSTYSLFHRK